jgi:ribonuclease P protein component
VVPRHQHTAVDRNKLKRRLRELARLELLPALRHGAASDVAIRARRDAYEVSVDALRADVAAIVQALPRTDTPANETGT